MMWDWVGYVDPDFVLSVVGCDQYGGWSDTAYCNPAYDKLYQKQGVTHRPGEAPGGSSGRCRRSSTATSRTSSSRSCS